MRTRIIGIGGPSGAGKSSLAGRLAAALPASECAVLGVDSYYHPLGHLTAEERASVNFDHPDSLDWALFLAHLEELRRGGSVAVPVYRFDLHTRSAESRAVGPARFVIAEGILALHRADVRALMDVKIYVETGERECFRRRRERDVCERGRTGESVERQYRATVLPMAEEFVWPTRAFADVVVSGEGGGEEAVREALARLRLISYFPAQNSTVSNRSSFAVEVNARAVTFENGLAKCLKIFEARKSEK